MTPADYDRILSYTKHDPETGCRTLTRCVASSGYGLVRVGGKKVLAHRALLEYHIGSIGKLSARHLCNNKACVERAHLVPGTHTDNMRDIPPEQRSAMAVKANKTRTPEVRKAASMKAYAARGVK